MWHGVHMVLYFKTTAFAGYGLQQWGRCCLCLTVQQCGGGSAPSPGWGWRTRVSPGSLDTLHPTRPKCSSALSPAAYWAQRCSRLWAEALDSSTHTQAQSEREKDKHTLNVKSSCVCPPSHTCAQVYRMWARRSVCRCCWSVGRSSLQERARPEVVTLMLLYVLLHLCWLLCSNTKTAHTQTHWFRA